MHPQFAYRRLAKELAAESGIGVYEVQHHHAHAASLLLDSGAGRLVAVTLDGTGYGPDGRVWGGEVLDADAKGFERIASLEELPLVGGENAIREPMRLVYAINEMLGGPLAASYDADFYSRAIRKSVGTTSFGRVLDALSAYLGVCDTMRYDGEPAMKLERLLSAGWPAYDFTTQSVSENGRTVIRTLPLFEHLFGLKLNTAKERADAAFSFVGALVEKMGEVSAEYANSKGLQVGLSGGVSYNRTVTAMLERAVGGPGVVLHSTIPNGDGGISAGQNIIAAGREG
jgi:hydrogenase maturation protein HypF